MILHRPNHFGRVQFVLPGPNHFGQEQIVKICPEKLQLEPNQNDLDQTKKTCLHPTKTIFTHPKQFRRSKIIFGPTIEGQGIRF